jgi:hypothetical protein
VIRTRVAKHLFGENLYFGHRTLADLLESETLTGIVAMGISGQRPTAEQRRVLDDLAVIITSADPRIWPLKLTRLVSSYGGTLAGYCAGQLAIEGERIGPWISGYIAADLAELREAIGDRLDDADAVASAVSAFVSRRGRIHGFGVPLRPSDERMDALRAYAGRTGLDRRIHWRVHEALADHMERVKGVPRNVGVGFAAVLLDVGFAVSQISALSHFLIQAPFVANAYEAARQRAPEMQRVADEHVAYVGPAPRESPRAAARAAKG